VIERTRAAYARLVGVPAGAAAIGSQASVQTSLIEAVVPAGAEVLVPARAVLLTPSPGDQDPLRPDGERVAGAQHAVRLALGPG
jgi:hypothetical protein